MVRTVRFELTLDSLSDCRLCQLGYIRLKWWAWKDSNLHGT
jgi:hypothetical protein